MKPGSPALQADSLTTEPPNTFSVSLPLFYRFGIPSDAVSTLDIVLDSRTSNKVSLNYSHFKNLLFCLLF